MEVWEVRHYDSEDAIVMALHPTRTERGGLVNPKLTIFLIGVFLSG